MSSMFRVPIWLCLMLCLASAAVGGPTTGPAPADMLLAQVAAKGPLLLHLPGVGGYLGCDRRMLAGLRDAGVDAHIVVYDWTEHDPGIHALQAYDRNQREAQTIADLIAAHAAADPDSPIYITAHSGGCGLAAWALEKLPADVKVQTVILIAPALSPRFDLSAALRHVNGKMFAFSSLLDSIVLYTGTRLFGTIDGVRTEAAGFCGFIQPPGADPLMYKKLVQRTYQRDWMKYNDFGQHIGAMSRSFASAMLAPLIGPIAGPATRADAGAGSTRSKG
jgi:pimeloyl-ACP methyl ester carboxylesterase